MTEDERNELLKRRQAFLLELFTLYRQHNMAISHEDGHGAFLLVNLDRHHINWMNAASFEVETPGEIVTERVSPWRPWPEVEEGEYAIGEAVIESALANVDDPADTFPKLSSWEVRALDA